MYVTTYLMCLLNMMKIKSAINKLKGSKGGGSNGFQPEHLKYRDHLIILWLQRTFNEISDIEDLPVCLKHSIVTWYCSSCIQGRGRDRLDPNNYRDITFASVISKCLEIILFNHLKPLLRRGSHITAKLHIRQASHVSTPSFPPKKPSYNICGMVNLQPFVVSTC